MPSLGDLVVTVGADVSGFASAINSVDDGLTTIAGKATAAGEAFDAGFLKSIGASADVLTETAASFRDATSALDPFAEAARQVGEAIEATVPPAFQFSQAAQEIIDTQAGLNAAAQESIATFNEISQAYQQGAASAQDVANAEAAMHSAINAANPSVHEAESGMGGFGSSLLEVAGLLGVGIGLESLVEGLKDVVGEAIEVYGRIQLVTTSLTALTGSAQSAEEILAEMKKLALGSIFPDEQLAQAAQKMAAIGVAAKSIPSAMTAVVHAAEATGNSLDGVSNALDRVYLSATIQPRSLATLGISMKDLAETIGVSADKVEETFKALGPQSDDALRILTATIEHRTKDAGDAVVGTIPNSINQLKVEWESLLEEFGKDISPGVISSLNDLVSTLKTLEPLISAVTNGLLHMGDGASTAVAGVKLLASTLTSASEAALGTSGNFDLVKAALSSIGDLINEKYSRITAAVDSLHAQAEEAKASTVSLAAGFAAFSNAATSGTHAGNDLSAAFTSISGSATGSKSSLDAAREAALKALAAHEALKVQLDSLKQSYETVKAQFESGRASQDQLAASLENLRKAAATAQKDFVEVAGATKDVQDGFAVLAQAQQALYVPAILDHATALLEVEKAQNRLKDAETQQLQTLSQLAAANTAYEAAHTPANAKAVAEADIAEEAAKVQVKQAIDALKTAKDALKLSETAEKEATQQLAAADKEYLDLIQGATEKVILPYTAALEEEKKAKDASVVAAINLKSAQANLEYAKATGDTEKFAQAQLALTAAQEGGKIALDNLKAAQQAVSDSRAAAVKIDKALADGQAELDAAYTKFTPHLQSLSSEMENVQAAQTRLIDAEQKETEALAALQALKAAGVNTGKEYQDAIAAESVAHSQLTAAERGLSDAEKQLQQDWGISAQAIQKIIDPLRNLTPLAQQAEAALVSLGITPAASLQELADKADTAYGAILSSGTTSSTQLREAQIADIKAHIAAQVAAGEEIPAAEQIQLAKLENQERDYQTNSVRRWHDMVVKIHDEISRISENFLNNVVDKFVGLFHGNAQNEQLDQQAADLQKSLAQQTADWEQYQADIQSKIDAAKQNYQTSLDSEVASLEDSLAKQKADYEQFVADKTEAYNRSVQDIQEKIGDVTAANAEDLQKDLDNLRQQLADKTESYDRYVQDINTKLSRIGENTAQDIKDETTRTNRAIADKQKQYDRDAEDTQKKIDRLTAANAKGNAQQITDLKLSLQRKKEDLDTFVQRTTDDLQTYTDEHKKQAEQQTADLNTQLQRQKEDYDQYVQENARQVQQTTLDHKTQLDQQLRDLHEQLQRQTEDYQNAVADKKAALDKFADDTAAKEEQARQDAAKKLAGELSDLQQNLADKQKAYDEYKTGIETQLDEIKSKHVTIWGEIKDLLTGPGGVFDQIGAAFLKAIVDPLTQPLTDALGGIFSTLATKVAGWLGGIFGQIPGLGGGGIGSLPINLGSGTATTIPGIPGLSGSAGGGTSGGAGASGFGSALGIVNTATGAISAVADVLSLFGIGRGGEKDRLNIIANSTSYLAWVFSAGGGHDALLNIQNSLVYYVGAFTGWYRDSIDWISDRITDSETWLRTIRDAVQNGLVVTGIEPKTTTPETPPAKTPEQVKQDQASAIAASIVQMQEQLAQLQAQYQAAVGSSRRNPADTASLSAQMAAVQAQIAAAQQQLVDLNAPGSPQTPNTNAPFTGWELYVANDLNQIEQNTLGLLTSVQQFVQTAFPDFASRVVSAIVPAATPVPPSQTPQIDISLRGDVYLDSEKLFTSFVKWGEDRGYIIPQS